MLSVRNLAGIEEPISDFQNLKRVRRINGEKTLSLTVLNSPGNEYCFDLIEEESVLTFGEDEYVIKVMSERSLGKRTAKHVEAIHSFYVNLINKQQTNIHNGSITFNNYMNLVFDDTDYTFVAIDPFLARSFENLGDDNRLSLLKKGLDRFKAEMELVGDQVRFKERIGNDTDFQFRYGHNIRTIERAVDTTNLATVIRGKGDPELGIEAYYESPNVSIFGVIDAPTVSDERFKSEESILEEMVSRLQDTPEFSLTIDFIDLRAAGYPYTIPNEGDSVFVIYEPMGDLEVDTRINEIEEYFNINLEPIETHVTLANHKKTFAGTMFDNVQKQIDGIVNDDGVIRYNVLDEAVKMTTEALKSVQTELEFENGIIARDKDNPNLLVLLNSAGIGVSQDGGQTFDTAMTGNGMVADLITAGVLQLSSGLTINNGDNVVMEVDTGSGEVYLNVSRLVLNTSGQNIEDLLDEKSNTDYVDSAVDGIMDEMEESNEAIRDMKSYFDFGDDGLEIGRAGSPLSLTLTNEQMSFIDNGSVVAYVNGQKMYIDSLEVLSSIILGNHKIEKYNDEITLINYSG